MRRWAAAAAGILLLGPALSGCGGLLSHSSSPTPTGATTSTPPPATSSPYVVLPDDVSTTAPGTSLRLGQPATVGWKPRESGPIGVLDISVTALRSTTFAASFQGWQLDKSTLQHTPYFVQAKVTNAGHSDLGGFPAPLFGLDDQGRLVEPATFGDTFGPCHPGAFPAHFRPGDTQHVCLVYLVPPHATLVGAAFGPDGVDPITWKGPVEPLHREKG